VLRLRNSLTDSTALAAAGCVAPPPNSAVTIRRRRACYDSLCQAACSRGASSVLLASRRRARLLFVRVHARTVTKLEFVAAATCKGSSAAKLASVPKFIRNKGATRRRSSRETQTVVEGNGNCSSKVFPHLRRLGYRLHRFQPTCPKPKCQASGHSDDCSFVTNPRPQSVEALSQFVVGASCADARPGTFHQPGADVPRTAFDQVPSLHQLSRTVLARREPEVVHERTGGGKAADVSELEPHANRGETSNPWLRSSALTTGAY
jgi:hypothetical protein